MDLADETYKADLVVYSENYSAASDALASANSRLPKRTL